MTFETLEPLRRHCMRWYFHATNYYQLECTACTSCTPSARCCFPLAPDQVLSLAHWHFGFHLKSVRLDLQRSFASRRRRVRAESGEISQLAPVSFISLLLSHVSVTLLHRIASKEQWRKYSTILSRNTKATMDLAVKVPKREGPCSGLNVNQVPQDSRE